MIALDSIDVKTKTFTKPVLWELSYNRIHHPMAHAGAKAWARLFVYHPSIDTLEAYRSRFKILTDGEAITC